MVIPNRILCLLLALASVLISDAQNFELEQLRQELESQDSLATAKRSGLISLGFSVELGSNSVRNDLIGGLYRGEFLSQEVRQNSSDAINESGIAGMELSADIRYTMFDSLFSKPYLGSMLSFGQRNMLGVRFQKELFDLTFFGNAPYENQEVQIGPSAAEQQVFQKLGWGFVNLKKRFSLLFSVVKGQTLQHVDLTDASIFTATDGRYLDVDLQGDYLVSDSSNTGFSALNGIGFNIDIAKAFSLKRWRLEAVLSDFGVIAWNRNTRKLSADSAYTYRGIQIENILDLNDLVVSEQTAYDTIGLERSYSSVLRLTPFQIRARMSQSKDPQQWNLWLDARYRYLAGYLPRIEAGTNKQFGSTMLSGSLIYGGFSGVRAALGASRQFGSTQLNVQASNLPGPLSGAGNGLGLFFYLSHRL